MSLQSPLALRVVRTSFTEKATEGSVLVRRTGSSTFDEKPVCYSLENPTRNPLQKVYGDTAIPFGRYRLALRHSPAFKREVLWLQQVPQFELIYFHAGNSPKDSLGCILVGMDATTPTDAWIGNSRAAETALFNLAAPEIRAKRPVWVEVVGPTLREGMGGRDSGLMFEAVRMLQRWLRMPDHLRTGFFGPMTRAYVGEFQRRVGLGDDGVAGPMTWAALLAP